jgi:hypothetical protein
VQVVEGYMNEFVSDTESSSRVVCTHPGCGKDVSKKNWKTHYVNNHNMRVITPKGRPSKQF